MGMGVRVGIGGWDGVFYYKLETFYFSEAFTIRTKKSGSTN